MKTKFFLEIEKNQNFPLRVIKVNNEFLEKKTSRGISDGICRRFFVGCIWCGQSLDHLLKNQVTATVYLLNVNPFSIL